MIIGMGIDIVDVNLLVESFYKSTRFVHKVFTQSEIDYCERKTDKFQHYAARFATKEAVMKALGIGWDKGVQWTQIELVRNELPITGICADETLVASLLSQNTRPFVRLHGKVLSLAQHMKVVNIHVSVSHIEYQAIAFVAVEGMLS